METVFCILAGGKSSRFKRDKRMAKLNGKPLIELIYNKLSKFSNSIVISARKGDYISLSGAKVIEDRKSFAGPLCGMFDVIKNIKADRYLFFAADMPFITETMIEKLIYEEPFSISLFECGGRIKPLPIAIPGDIKIDNIECENRRILYLLELFSYRIFKLDSRDCREFFNINTQEELELASKLNLE